MSHRDRLRELVQLLDECPFDVDELREQLGAIHLMVNDDAADVIRQTVHQLDEVKLTLSLTDWTELSEDERTDRHSRRTFTRGERTPSRPSEAGKGYPSYVAAQQLVVTDLVCAAAPPGYCGSAAVA